jgi:NADH dehydrogenase
VAMVGKFHFSGLLAWLSWLFIHLIYLIGFRNRFVVLFQWIYSYFTFKRGARIIATNPETPKITVDSKPKELTQVSA